MEEIILSKPIWLVRLSNPDTKICPLTIGNFSQNEQLYSDQIPFLIGWKHQWVANKLYNKLGSIQCRSSAEICQNRIFDNREWRQLQYKLIYFDMMKNKLLRKKSCRQALFVINEISRNIPIELIRNLFLNLLAYITCPSNNKCFC